MALALAVSLTAGAWGVSSAAAPAADAAELHLQPVTDAGPDPWTKSTATPAAGSSAPPPATAKPPKQAPAPRALSGATQGLYGGTLDKASCDVEKQIRFLDANHDKRDAFAKVEGVKSDEVPVFLRSLTSVVLRADTRVTNHGFADGRATTFQSVLQAGTAVLVDDHGVPRVRCACGNPLTKAGATPSKVVYKGEAWTSYRPEQVVVVDRSTTVINTIVIVDVVTNVWIARPVEDSGKPDDNVVPAPPDPGPIPPVPAPDPDGGESPAAPLPAPTGLEGAATGPTTVRLTWDPQRDTNEVTGYEVYVKGRPDPVRKTKVTDVEIDGLEAGTEYVFTVKAVGGDRTSEASEPLTVTTPAQEGGSPPPEEPGSPPEMPAPEEPGAPEGGGQDGGEVPGDAPGGRDAPEEQTEELSPEDGPASLEPAAWRDLDALRGAYGLPVLKAAGE
ncbi:DUF6777 domain-containing protein [Streptomyces polyrhachis]|uniref:DUF6777 domain-containing protein n=1 Tax=Streptomyces polyrhachis TaxID=1282885 RepID=A0ABW2GJ66_9ACTN